MLRALTSSAAARAVTVVGSLALVPWLLDELGAAGYGRWAAIAAVLAFVPFLDLGVGVSTLTRVAQAEGRSDRDEQRRTVSTAWAMLCAIALVVFLLMAVGFSVGGEQVVRLDAPTTSALIVAAPFIVATLPLSLGPRLQLALQTGEKAGLWSLAGGILTLLATVASLVQGTGLVGLVVAWGLGWLVTNLGSSLGVMVRRSDLRPRVSLFSATTARALGHDMTLYSLLQASSWATAAADPLIVATLRSEPEAATYAVTQQLMMLPSQAISLAVLPLWSAFGEAWGRGDVGWMRRHLGWSLVLGGLVSLGSSLALLAAAPWVSRIWVQGRLSTDFALLLGLALAGTALSVGAIASALFNAMGLLRVQVLLAGALIFFSLGGKLLFVADAGIRVMPWATLGAYALCVLVPYSMLISKHLRGGPKR